MNQTKLYEIRIKGHLGPSCVNAFPGLTVRHEVSGHTILTGPIADQAALHGVLILIRDLGLTLIALNCLDELEKNQ